MSGSLRVRGGFNFIDRTRAMSDLIPFKNKEIISKDKIQLVKDTICKGATDDELEMFLMNCNRTGLDPFAKQCWAVKRWDSSLGREVMAFQTGVDGFRIIANRSEKYSGQIGPYWCGEDGQWTDVWLKSTPPTAAKIGVLRSDFKEPLWAVARFSGYAAKKKDGSLTQFWSKMPDLMIAKVAECLALRKAFPQDLSGVYSDTEMEQAEFKDVVETNKPKDINTLKEAVKPENHIFEQIEDKNPEVLKSESTKAEEPYIARFPKKESVLINREQAEFLKTVGFKFGHTLEQINMLIYQQTKKIRWSDLNNQEFDEILALLEARKKGN